MGTLSTFIKHVKKGDYFDQVVRWSREFDASYAVGRPMYREVVVLAGPRAPENLEHILKGNFDNYVKGHDFDHFFGELLGGGVFNSDGSAWSSQRKAASHIFTKNNFRSTMVPTFARYACTKLCQHTLRVTSWIIVVGMPQMWPTF